jgi:hypothetical protein
MKSLNEKPAHKEINTLLKIKEELSIFISSNQLLKKILLSIKIIMI